MTPISSCLIGVHHHHNKLHRLMKAGRSFVVTHPFHPLSGQEFESLGQNNRWGDWRVWFRDATGAVRTIPLTFTTLAPLTNASVSPRGTLFRARDLLELADLVRSMEGSVK